MKLEVKLPKGNALSLGNALRQMALSRLPAWRPVAFSLNRDFNLLHATPDIIEDPFMIAANLADFIYVPLGNRSGSFLKEKFTFVGGFKSSDMKSEFFNVIGDDSKNLITCINDKEVVLTVVYRYGVGLIDTLSNSEFLVENGERKEDYRVLSSRHTDVREFTFDVQDSSLEEQKLILTVKSDTADELQILNDSIQCLRDSITMLSHIISNKDPENYYEKEPPAALRV